MQWYVQIVASQVTKHAERADSHHIPVSSKKQLNQKQNTSYNTVAVLSKTAKVAVNLFLNIKKAHTPAQRNNSPKMKIYYITLYERTVSKCKCTNKIENGAMSEVLRAQIDLRIE